MLTTAHKIGKIFEELDKKAPGICLFPDNGVAKDRSRAPCCMQLFHSCMRAASDR